VRVVQRLGSLISSSNIQPRCEYDCEYCAKGAVIVQRPWLVRIGGWSCDGDDKL
jgi:hypothetical protein